MVLPPLARFPNPEFPPPASLDPQAAAVVCVVQWDGMGEGVWVGRETGLES